MTKFMWKMTMMMMVMMGGDDDDGGRVDGGVGDGDKNDFDVSKNFQGDQGDIDLLSN